MNETPPLLPVTLPPFSGDQAVCPKCGHEGETDVTLYNDPIDPHMGSIGWVKRRTMDRTCRRCGYTWPEATQDTSLDGCSQCEQDEEDR